MAEADKAQVILASEAAKQDLVNRAEGGSLLMIRLNKYIEYPVVYALLGCCVE